MALTLVVSIDVVELICLDFPMLDIYKAGYEYDKEVKDKGSWQLVEAMMQVPNLPMLEQLKSRDHLLIAEEILHAKVGEDPTFRTGLECLVPRTTNCLSCTY